MKVFSPNTELISKEYINNREPLEFVCECGKTFQKNWDTIWRMKKCLCNSCSKKEGWNRIRREDNQGEIFAQIFLNNGFKPLEQITSARDKILCEDLNGYRGYINKLNVELGKHFSVFSIRFNEENFLYNLNNYIRINNLNVKIRGYEPNNRTYETKLFCTCECGNDFEAFLSNFATQYQWRCPVCSKSESNLEYKTELELKKYCVFEKQKGLMIAEI